MSRHLSNAASGVLDYAAYPAAMLIATPILLHHLGSSGFGIWLVANAAISAGSIVSSGFGDALIHRIATCRATGDIRSIKAAVGNMLTINLVLGIALAVILFTLVPFAAHRITRFDPTLAVSCIISLRIGAALIILKSIESVFIGAQRAHGHYASAVGIGVATRLLAIVIAVALSIKGFGVPSIVFSTALITVAGIAAQWNAMRALGIDTIVPTFNRTAFQNLASFGAFSWLQAISGVFFSQADRLILALLLGASAVSYYGVCVQIAQPIHGLTAAGLHFLFPYLSQHHASTDAASTRRPIFRALAINILVATLFAAILVVFGNALLRRWMGDTFAVQSPTLLPTLALSFAMLSLNVTGHYAMLALGRVRTVTAFNIAGGLLMLTLIVVLVPRLGLTGAAIARLCFGPITCLLYIPLFRTLFRKQLRPITFAAVAMEEA